jgi:hypothetical protein
MANVHPWFAAQSIQDAAGWTADFFATTNVAAANALSNKVRLSSSFPSSRLIMKLLLFRSAHNVHCGDGLANSVFIYS